MWDIGARMMCVKHRIGITTDIFMPWVPYLLHYIVLNRVLMSVLMSMRGPVSRDTAYKVSRSVGHVVIPNDRLPRLSYTT